MRGFFVYTFACHYGKYILILRCKPEDAQNKFASALLHLLIQFDRLANSLSQKGARLCRLLPKGRKTVPFVRFHIHTYIILFI